MATADWREIVRTRPDRVLFDPTGGRPRDWDDPDFFWLNEQILVGHTGDGSLLATWTTQRLAPHALRIATSRSCDGGRTWTPAHYVDGDGLGGGPACWQVPVIPPSGRVYLLYPHDDRAGAGGFCGGFRWRYSDDHGVSWSAPFDLAFPRGAIDVPDPKQPPVWICCSGPHTDAHGRTLIPYTHWASTGSVPAQKSRDSV